MSDTLIAVSQIKAVSHHRLKHFEDCKKRAKLMFVDKIKEPDRPLKPGQTETHANRGIRIHKSAELYVNGTEPELIADLSKFRLEYERLRELFVAGKVSLEGDWAFNDAWQVCDWFADDVFMRMKLDAMVTVEPSHALIVDLKTGKKMGNEVKHADQMALFQLGTFLRYPELEKVTVELWYADQDELTRQIYTRAQGMRHLKNFNRRALAVTECVVFPPNANQYTCLFCPFGKKNGDASCTDSK